MYDFSLHILFLLMGGSPSVGWDDRHESRLHILDFDMGMEH